MQLHVLQSQFPFQTLLICNFQIHKSPLKTFGVFLFRIRLGGLTSLKTLLSDLESRIAAEAKLQRSHSESPSLRKYSLEDFSLHDKHVSVVTKAGFILFQLGSAVRFPNSSIVIARLITIYLFFSSGLIIN